MSAPDNLMPVLFLDFDDVLCLNNQFGGFDAIEAIHGRHFNAGLVYRRLFAPQACDVLHRVHEAMGGRLRYVVSSTWREFFGRDELCELLRLCGLDFVAAALHEPDRWRTPSKVGRGQRVDEIAAWLDRHHRGEPFAIVDDHFSGASLKPALTLPAHPFRGRVVLCEECLGLSDKHAQPLVDALGRPAVLPNQGAGE